MYTVYPDDRSILSLKWPDDFLQDSELLFCLSDDDDDNDVSFTASSLKSHYLTECVSAQSVSTVFNLFLCSAADQTDRRIKFTRQIKH